MADRIATDEQILKACGKKGKTSEQLANQLGMSRQHILRRLRKLTPKQVTKVGTASPKTAPVYKVAA